MRENKRLQIIVRTIATLARLGFGITFVEISGKLFFTICNSMQYFLSNKTIYCDFSFPILLDVFIIFLIILVQKEHIKKPKDTLLNKIYWASGEMMTIGFRSSEFLFPILLIITFLTDSPYFVKDIQHFVLSAVIIVLFEFLSFIVNKSESS